MKLTIGNATSLVAEIFASTGMDADDARTLTDSLIYSETRGITTHGLKRVESYYRLLTEGLVHSSPKEKIVDDGEGTALIEGGGGFGAPVGLRAVDLGMDKARRNGISYIGVRNVAHFGAAGFYTSYAAQRGFLAIAGSSSSPSVLPFGAIEPKIGNSPMSFASPDGEGASFMLDMAQSATSRGRIRLAEEKGEAIPSGWAVDEHGNDTTDAAAALVGGLLPSGGHKGSGLSLMVEMLAAGLTGATLTQDTVNVGMTAATLPEGIEPNRILVGNFYILIDANLFGDSGAIFARSAAIADNVRAARPRPGFDSVLAPGDPERLKLAHAVEDGIEIEDSTANQLRVVAEQAGIAVAGQAGTDTRYLGGQ